MESPTNKQLAVYLAVALVVSLVLGVWMMMSQPQSQTEETLVGLLPADGTPALISQSKVGDDAVPHIHQTWCQLLPYKRHIQDDRIFCYIEIIDDWSVE